MRIDAHHHFWQIGRYTYPWMGPELAVLRRDFGPPELEPFLKHHRIDGTVLVQTISSLDETRWFLQLAKKYPFIMGVVGWVELTDPNVGHTLDELRAAGPLVGIRHQVHDEPEVNWLLRPAVQRGLQELAARSIPYDLLIRPPHLEVSLEVACAFPNLSLVVNHVAKPQIARNGWDDWAVGIRELGQCPNVCCKLSGMITEADWAHWKPIDLRRYIEHVLESFGPRRVMFGSDWPVCLLAGSYDQVVDALSFNLARLSDADLDNVFGNNAARFYRLNNRL